MRTTLIAAAVLLTAALALTGCNEQKEEAPALQEFTRARSAWERGDDSFRIQKADCRAAVNEQEATEATENRSLCFLF